ALAIFLNLRKGRSGDEGTPCNDKEVELAIEQCHKDMNNPTSESPQATELLSFNDNDDSWDGHDEAIKYLGDAWSEVSNDESVQWYNPDSDT
ncbi:hypothetical protein, partial [Kistimonas scapharcae]|uniref:hypothetical protein n=1 Tax=Kistimonas scapharcae TaxID=1036133 RepID=UPI0031EC7C21